jgi:hypothetical protein
LEIAMKRLALLVVPCVLLVAISFCCIGPGSPTGPDTGGLDPSDVAADVSVVGASRAASSKPPLEDEELVRQLRAVGRAFARGDARLVKDHVEMLLEARDTPHRVLERLAGGKLPGDEAARSGAVLFLGLVVARAGRGGGLAGLDARAFTLDVLAALPELKAPLDKQLATVLASLEIEGRPAIGARYLVPIVELRTRRPDRALVFDPLLEALARNAQELVLLEAEMPALTQILSESSDPLVVRAVMSALIAADPQNFVPIAEDAFHKSRRNPVLYHEIAHAIASHAPIEMAVAVLPRLGTDTLYPEFNALGEREGALDAVENEYSRLMASDENPRGRKMLVAAMGRSSSGALLGIAETDPTDNVRVQALLTLTLQPAADDLAVMQAVRRARAAAGDPARGFDTARQLMVLHNLAGSRKGTAKNDVIALLREIAASAEESIQDRRQAHEILERLLPESEWNAIPVPR